MSYDFGEFAGLFARGAGITIWISWLALLLGGAIGTAVGLAQISRSRIVRLLAVFYVELFRSIPILVLLFFCYFGLPLIFNLDVSPFAAATTALGLETSAAMAVVVRAGVASVGRGQSEAGLALGLHKFQLWLRVIMPQALRVILPPSVGIYISTLKDSSLASIIGYVELTKTGLLIRNSTGENVRVLLVVAALYFIINFAISRVGAHLERMNQIAA
jgi:His/Glu/Gln/Arg/opine family amino acid ABC transporter permease subunit